MQIKVLENTPQLIRVALRRDLHLTSLFTLPTIPPTTAGFFASRFLDAFPACADKKQVPECGTCNEVMRTQQGISARERLEGFR